VGRRPLAQSQIGNPKSKMVHDLRFAFRQLSKSPGFTAVAVFTLALGLAVNTVFLTIANDLFFRPLPAEAPDRLVLVAQKAPAIGYQVPFSYADAEDFRRFVETGGSAVPDMARVFSGLMAYKEEVVHLSRAGESTERTWVHAVTDNYFTVLGVQPHLGRFFLPGEARTPGADPIFILTYDTWQSRFHADPGIIGRTVKVNGLPLTVVGIAPPGFFGASWGTALSGFVPVTMLPRLLPGGEYYALKRGNTSVFLMGRLKPDASLPQAQAAMEVAYARIMHNNPGYYLADAHAVVMRESHSRPSPYIAQYTPKIMAALTSLSLLVLAVAIANVANLLYARAASRERELAIRAAVGATRFHLIRGLQAESAVLALVAGMVGAIASLWLTPFLIGLIPTSSTGAPPAEAGLDWRPFAATGLASLLVGLASGLLPALKASGIAPQPFLKESTPLASRQRHPLRRLLVVGQVAVSCLVLVCASLALRSMILLSRVDLGFQPKHLVVASFDLGLQNYSPDQGRRFHARLLEQVRALPGVEAASLSTNTPLDMRIALDGGITAVGEPAPAGTVPPPVAWIFVDPAYLSTIGLRLEAGRDFTAHDGVGAPLVAIVNRALANQLWPGKDPIGRRLSAQGNETEVIGVVGRNRFYNLADDSQPLLISALAQNYRSGLVLAVRTTGATVPLTSAITKIVRQLDPDLPLFGVQTMEQQIVESPNGLMPYRIGAIFAGFQGAIALLLAGAGIFGLITFTVARRTREIGIRMALGASRMQVIRAVTRESIVLTVAGLAVGIVLSWALARMLANLLYGAGTMDVAVFGGVVLLVLLATALACWLPARRATRINPIDALRTE
jgi:predicted permease